MSLLKTTAKWALARAGYRISRINPPAPAATLAPRRIVNAHYKDHCFKCFMGDYLSDCILTGRGWDNQLESILDRVVATWGSGDVVEIGANIGASLVPLASSYPSLSFHCVEPVPDFFAMLRANAQSYGAINVTLHNVAMAAEDGKPVELHVQVGTAGALRSYDNHIPVGTERIKATSLDTLFSGHDVKLIKLDVDGFELEVLRGATLTLNRCRPMCFVEFHTRIMREVGVDPLTVCALFQQFGYRKVTIYDDGAVLKTTNSFNELVEIADSVPYYVDALIERT